MLGLGAITKSRALESLAKNTELNDLAIDYLLQCVADDTMLILNPEYPKTVKKSTSYRRT